MQLEVSDLHTEREVAFFDRHSSVLEWGSLHVDFHVILEHHLLQNGMRTLKVLHKN